MDEIAGRRMVAGDQAEPLERLPETGPFRLQLPGAEDAVGIGADREKRRIAEVEEAGEADDDVEAERQRREGERIGDRIDVRVVPVHEREQQRRRRDAEDAETRAAAGSHTRDRSEHRRPRPEAGPETHGPDRRRLADFRHLRI